MQILKRHIRVCVYKNVNSEQGELAKLKINK